MVSCPGCVEARITTPAAGYLLLLLAALTVRVAALLSQPAARRHSTASPAWSSSRSESPRSHDPLTVATGDRLTDARGQGAVDAAANSKTEGRRQVGDVEPGDLERLRAADGSAAVRCGSSEAQVEVAAGAPRWAVVGEDLDVDQVGLQAQIEEAALLDRFA